MADNMNHSDENPSERRELNRRELFQMLNPGRAFTSWGRLAIDASKCSACGLCAGSCENKALTAISDDCLTLTFRSDLCDFCGKCIEVCPESALSHGPLGEKDNPSEVIVLFHDEPALCLKCGVIFGSKAMVRCISAKLEKTDPVVARKVQMCLECRAGSA